MRFDALDGWRGIAALMVSLFHFNAYHHFVASPFIRNAHLYVDFFFVLSGFVIAHAYADKLTGGGGVTESLCCKKIWTNLSAAYCYAASPDNPGIR